MSVQISKKLLVSRILLQLVSRMFIYIYYLFWDHLGEWDQLGSHFIYRNRDDTVSYKSNYNVLPSYKSWCKMIPRVAMDISMIPWVTKATSMFLQVTKAIVMVPRCCDSDHNNIANCNVIPMDKNCYCSPHNCQWNIYRCTNPYGFKKQCV